MGIVPSFGARTRSVWRRSGAALWVALIVLLVVPAVPAAADVPAPLQDDLVGALPFPTDIDINPAGDILVASQTGGLYFGRAGQNRIDLALDLRGSICSNVERGLLGATFDPNFASNGYVFLYYTARTADGCAQGPEQASSAQTARSSAAEDARAPSAKKRALARCERIEKPNRRASCRKRTNRSFGPTAPTTPPGSAPNTPVAPTPDGSPAAAPSGQPVNQVVRFTLDANGKTDFGSRFILINNIPSPAGNHNAGDLEFGKDGLLYVSVGDGGANPNSAQDPSKLLGKILRVTSAGVAPGANPYQASGVSCAAAGRAPAGVPCQEIFAVGLRNPFRIAFDPNASGTRFYINDVGQNTREEIDLGQVGANYGWPTCEGSFVQGSSSQRCTQNGAQDPVHEYAHTPGPDGCRSITGGAFTPAGALGGDYDGGYFFADFVCDRIFFLPRNGAAENFASNLGAVVPLAFASDGSLYYGTYNNGGEIRRISDPT